jgi:RNA recognition motif-containing protein
MDIFVAKLNSITTVEQVTELFSQFGTVSSAKLIMDRDTGKSKCYGFVEMANEAEGANAIQQLNESNFMGNFIVVKQSEPKAQEKRSFDRKPSFGGGGGGGSRRPDGNRPDGNRRFDRNFNSNSPRSAGGGERRDNNRERGYNRYE